MSNFVHLHLHTEYSLLDGVSKIKPLIKKVQELGMTACGLTDHGVMYGTYEFWSACKAAGVKPIIGCEVYVAGRSRHDKETGIDNERYHLTLLAKNKTGYHNLLKMVSLAHVEGYYYKPRVDRELLQQYGEGVIALSGCLASNFNRYLASGKREEAIEWLKFLQSCVTDLYVEIQRNGIPESLELIPTQLEIAKEMGLEVVATCDTHYLAREDHRIQEIAWCISDGTRLDDPNRRQYGSTEFYLKGPDEMAELFADMPEVLENTQKVADSVEEYSIDFDRVQPKFNKEMTYEETRQKLVDMTYTKAKERYPEITPEMQQRIDYELEVINNKGYNDYFLVVYDYINWARSQGILVGPGRGSGAGSVVAYSLGITNLDPFKYNLIFERFLNPERPSPPDFDIDFQDDRRDELFTYMAQRYGADSTSFIGTYGRLKTKAAIRDVARAMGIDLGVADKLSKMVIVKFGKVYTIEKMRKEVPEFDAMVKSDPILEELVGYVVKLEEVARHVSIHASGFLVTPNPITDYLPVQQESKGGSKIVTQFEGSQIESLGLMKFDFLGLANLTIIGNALKQIRQNTGTDIDIDKIPLYDPQTYELFQKAQTTAVFQFESGGMKRYLKELRPTNFEDLIFMNAAYRPGAMDYISDYIARKNGKQKVTYPHDCLSEVLSDTFGFAIYQEQVMNIAVVFAGYSLGEADMLRRAMGKKKIEIMMKEKEKFLTKGKENGHTEEEGEKVFSYLEPFANYGFNRSHAAAYALIAYQTAYLKAHYPLEFIAGLMETDLGALEKLQRDLEEAKAMNIAVLAPDVNSSLFTFGIEDNKAIRYGLGAIKGAGAKVMEHIVNERVENGPFTSLDDLVNRVGRENLSKKDLECLIKVGALDKFGPRNGLLAVMPAVFDRFQTKKPVDANQIDMFSILAPSDGTKAKVSATPLPVLDPLTDSQKVQWEKELLGVFISTHPLNNYRWATHLFNFTHLSDFMMETSDEGEEIHPRKLKEGSKVRVLGIIDTIKSIRTKTSGKNMSFLTISDFTGNCEAVMFNGTHEKYIGQIKEADAVIIDGTVSYRNDTCSMLVDKITPASTLSQPGGITLDIRKVSDSDELAKLKGCFEEGGELEVTIIYGDKLSPKKMKRQTSLNEECLETISKYLVKEKA